MSDDVSVSRVHQSSRSVERVGDDIGKIEANSAIIKHRRNSSDSPGRTVRSVRHQKAVVKRAKRSEEEPMITRLRSAGIDKGCRSIKENTRPQETAHSRHLG